LADPLEAVIGAVHLDGGIEAARTVVHQHILKALDSADFSATVGASDFKSALQQKVLALGLPIPRYTTVNTSGPEHAKIFVVEGRIGDQYIARGSASSKKEASQHAAAELLQMMNASSVTLAVSK
jgi:ribonuclease-3